jgi:protein SCO1
VILRLALLLALLATPAAAFDPLHDATIDSRPGDRIPLDHRFTDEAGQPVTLAGLAQGHPIVLAPVLHACPNLCGITLAGLAQAIAGQSFRPGADFALVAFGIDPNEGPGDAAAALARLRDAFPETAAAHGLTGAAPNVAAVTDALGYRSTTDPETGQIAHIAATAVLTPDGRLSAWLYGIAPDPADLRLALTEASGGKLGTWSDRLLLLCYHYDPQTGRYGSLVLTLLRAGGAATAGLGALLIGAAFVRERRRRP